MAVSADNLFNIEVGIAIGVLIAFAFCVCWIVQHPPVANWLNGCTKFETSLVTLPAFLFAFVATQLASDLRENQIKAHDSLIREVSALRNMIMYGSLCGDDGQSLRAAIANYVRAVLDREWVAMIRADQSNKESALIELRNLGSTGLQLSKNGTTSSQFASLFFGNLEKLREARLQRLDLAHEAMGFRGWARLLVFGALPLIAVALNHIGRPRALRTSVWVVMVCIAMMLYETSRFRSPYAGAGSVSSAPLSETLKLLEALPGN